jgi:hypothetical protein
MDGTRIGAGQRQPMGRAYGYFNKAGEKNTEKPNKTEKTIAKLQERAEARFEKMLNQVRELVAKQGGLASGKLTVHVEVRIELVNDLAEDGYWGAEKTAERILAFAKDLSGGDPTKIELLRDAVIKGFGEAEKLLGELPEVSQRTYELVMKGFDAWTAEFGE